MWNFFFASQERFCVVRAQFFHHERTFFPLEDFFASQERFCVIRTFLRHKSNTFASEEHLCVIRATFCIIRATFLHHKSNNFAIKEHNSLSQQHFYGLIFPSKEHNFCVTRTCLRHNDLARAFLRHKSMIFVSQEHFFAL